MLRYLTARDESSSLLFSQLKGESLTVEQTIAKSAECVGEDFIAVETRWSKAFRYVGDMAKFTGILASFAGAIATGLQVYRDIKNGAPPAKIAFEVIEV